MRTKEATLPEEFLREDWIILGVDPGLSATGLCLLDGASQTATFATVRIGGRSLARRADAIAHKAQWLCAGYGTSVDLLVIEHMQVYEQRKQKGNPNDLIDLAFLEGCIAAKLSWANIEQPTPRQWKGGIDKDIHHRRLRRQHPWLPPRISKDAMDAFGLALHGKEYLECQSLSATRKR